MLADAIPALQPDEQWGRRGIRAERRSWHRRFRKTSPVAAAELIALIRWAARRRGERVERSAEVWTVKRRRASRPSRSRREGGGARVLLKDLYPWADFRGCGGAHCQRGESEPIAGFIAKYRRAREEPRPRAPRCRRERVPRGPEMVTTTTTRWSSALARTERPYR